MLCKFRKRNQILKKKIGIHLGTAPGGYAALCPDNHQATKLHNRIRIGFPGCLLAVETELHAYGSTESERAAGSSPVSNVNWKKERQKLQCGDMKPLKGKGFIKVKFSKSFSLSGITLLWRGLLFQKKDVGSG